MQGLTSSHLVSCLKILHFVEILLITMLRMISRQWKLTKDELSVTQEDALTMETIKYNCPLLYFFPLAFFISQISFQLSICFKSLLRTSRENMKQKTSSEIILGCQQMPSFPLCCLNYVLNHNTLILPKGHLKVHIYHVWIS